MKILNLAKTTESIIEIILLCLFVEPRDDDDPTLDGYIIGTLHFAGPPSTSSFSIINYKRSIITVVKKEVWVSAFDSLAA